MQELSQEQLLELVKSLSTRLDAVESNSPNSRHAPIRKSLRMCCLPSVPLCPRTWATRARLELCTSAATCVPGLRRVVRPCGSNPSLVEDRRKSHET